MARKSLRNSVPRQHVIICLLAHCQHFLIMSKIIVNHLIKNKLAKIATGNFSHINMNKY